MGETGLDFYYNNSHKEIQIKSFEEHIKASLELEKTLIIHYQMLRLREKIINSILLKKQKKMD